MVEKSLKKRLKGIALKLNSKLQAIMDLSSVKNNNDLTLWVCLMLGLMGCLVVGLVPFAYHPQFAVMPAPFFRGGPVHKEKAFEKFQSAADDKWAKARAKANLALERKMFVRYALQRRKNVSNNLLRVVVLVTCKGRCQ